jgi:hypothetical protein
LVEQKAAVKEPWMSESPESLEKLYNLVYCSRATDEMSERELASLMRVAKAKNRKRDITGLLVHSHGMFLQVLEGPREAVEELMRELYCDGRHDGIIRLQSLEDVRERLYPGWTMQLVEPGQIREILNDSRARAHHPRQAHAITLLIELLDSQTLSPMLLAN